MITDKPQNTSFENEISQPVQVNQNENDQIFSYFNAPEKEN